MTAPDEWAWLRADDWQACVADPSQLPHAIAEHLRAENARADAWFAQDAALIETLLDELRGRIEPDDDSLPVADGPWEYLARYRDGDEYGVHLRRPRGGGEEQVLLDSEIEADGHDYFDEGDVEHAPDHRHFAWSADTSGDERYALFIRRLSDGCDILRIDDVYEVTWATGDTFFYSRVDEALRPSRVFRHTLGDDPIDDVMVFEEHDERFTVGIGTTRSGAFVVIDSAMTDCNETWLIPCSDPCAAPRVVEPRTDGLEYALEHQPSVHGERFVLLTNVDGAADFCLVEAPVDDPGRTRWRVIEAHRAGRLLLDVEALGDWLLILYRQAALPQLWLRHRDGRERVLRFDEPAYALSLDAGMEFDADRFRFTYCSPTTPDREYEQLLEGGEPQLLKERRVPSGHEPSDYVVQRRLIDSYDGTPVPVILLHHRTTPLDGSAACLIGGYGAYGSSSPATFSGSVLSLIDRGAVYAIAHVRGGQECGRAWYEAGRREHKHQSFEDLFAVATGLADGGTVAAGRIVLQGGSAGGLLVAATMDLAVRRRPGWLAGVIADVPFVDVLNTMLDATLPLTPGEWSEWGDPITDAAARERLAGYAPYERVGAFDYPPLYVTAGVSDPRVTWWEPAKWVARLRARRLNDAPLLLRTNMESGHFGETGRYGALGDSARELAFFLRVTGLADAEKR